MGVVRAMYHHANRGSEQRPVKIDTTTSENMVRTDMTYAYLDSSRGDVRRDSQVLYILSKCVREAPWNVCQQRAMTHYAETWNKRTNISAPLVQSREFACFTTLIHVWQSHGRCWKPGEGIEPGREWCRQDTGWEGHSEYIRRPVEI